MREKGFTLIELLVVIAIIGILSVVVLASLNDARNSAKDVAIKQQVRSYANLLALERAETGSFQNHLTFWIGNTGGNPDCNGESYTGSRAEEFRALCQGITYQQNFQTNNLMFVGVSPFVDNSYSITVRLNNGNWYCIGSSGRTYEGPLNPGTGGGTGSGCYANP